MDKSTQIMMEIAFNSLYLITIWYLVFQMWRRQKSDHNLNTRITRFFTLAFLFLAVGDTGHVGLRIVGYLAENLELSLQIGTRSFGLVGIGALATAITMSVFYIFMLFIWKEFANKSFSAVHYFLLSLMLLRFVIMSFPQNQWNNLVAPLDWSLLRNIPLTIFGLSVAYFFIRDAIIHKDKVFLWIGICIVISYAFYMPVILFVQQIPLIGMLMIPKTIAYVAIAVIGLNKLFNQNKLNYWRSKNVRNRISHS